jgi:hypothetical protein
MQDDVILLAWVCMLQLFRWWLSLRFPVDRFPNPHLRLPPSLSLFFSFNLNLNLNKINGNPIAISSYQSRDRFSPQLAIHPKL